MKINYNSIQIFVVEDEQAMSKKAANMVAGQIHLKSDSILGLATGSTPEGMYKNLVQMHRDGDLDFSDVTTFNLDEYEGLSPDNCHSYAWYMDHHLFGQVNVNEYRIHIPMSSGLDVDAVCARYDKLIEESHNIDLQILGIGTNGHIGFNEPDVKFEAGTHLVSLDEETIEANSRFFESTIDVPKRAISMGIRNIMHAKKVILMANGANKGKAIKAMVLGPVTPELPASVLQLHNDVTMIVDKSAGKLLLEAFNQKGITTLSKV
ncbi:MAG: glucosamine-6-phosphate deaminase [Clostridiales bacterium]